MPWNTLANAAMFFQNREDVEENNNAARRHAENQTNQTLAFNSAEALANRNYQERMDNSRWQRTIADLKAANLNPMLAYQQGPGHTPSGATAQGSGTSAGHGQPSIGHPTSLISTTVSASQLELNEALTDKTKAEAAEVRARTPTHAVTIEVMQQNIKESLERIQRIQQEVKTGASSAAHLDQQTANLKAMLPQITATINNLRAQTKQTGTMTGLTEEQTKELRQRILQNLPALENALKQLEIGKHQFDVPRQRQESATHEGALGTLSSILRNIIPFARH